MFFEGPLASLVANRFSHRVTVLLGGVMTTTGMFLSAHAPNIYFLYATYGVLTGLGFCFVYVPSVVIVGLYFDKRRCLAMGISVSGCGAGSLIFAPLLQALVDGWGWRGALILSAGICFQCCVMGSLLRPLEDNMCRMKSKGNKVTYDISSLFELSLLQDIKFIIFVVNNVLWNIGSLILLVLLPDYAIFCGINKDRAAYLLSGIGLCNFIGRLIIAMIANHKRCNIFLVFVISTGLTGLVIAVFPTTCNYAVLVTCCAIYGLVFGMQVGVLPLVSVRLFGVERITSAYGYLMFGNGTGALIGPPIAGVLYDVTQSYEMPFYFGGGVTLMSAVLVLAIPLISSMKYKNRKLSQLIIGRKSKAEQIKIFEEGVGTYSSPPSLRTQLIGHYVDVQRSATIPILRKPIRII